MKKIGLLFLAAYTLSSARGQQAGDTAAACEYRMKEYPILFQQTAAEYRALCYQAFNLATWQIDRIPGKQVRREKLAIITDLDETILDNSQQQAQLILDNRSFSTSSWKEWTSLSSAKAVPGAEAFLQRVHARGIAIFYVSNRDTAELRSTLVNLQRLGLPDADTSHMLFLSDTPSKEPRRQRIGRQYSIVMLLGDNLNDFMDIFEKKSIAERFAATDREKEQWGKRFIVLPNAYYGEWENAIWGYRHGLSPREKESARRSRLAGYKENRP